MTEEDEEFERIAAKCKETQRVNESKWNSEMSPEGQEHLRTLWKYSNKRLKVIYFSWERWDWARRQGFYEQCFPPHQGDFDD